MFRIPLKLGKNNDIVDTNSEIDSYTDRQLDSRRSFDEMA
jgi:hypothetical protein